MLKADNKDTRTTLITLVTGGTSKVRIVKSIHAKLSLMLNSFMTEIPIIQKPVHRFCKANQWTCFYIIETSIMKELNNVTYEQTGKTRKCSKFEVKTMTLYIEFCVKHVQR